MVILFKDGERSLIYDNKMRVFRFVDSKGSYYVLPEKLIKKMESGEIERVPDMLFLEEFENIKKSLKEVAEEEYLKKLLKKYNAKVVNKNSINELEIPGLVSLFKQNGVSSDKIKIMLSRVIHYLIEKYYKNKDIPSLLSVLRAIDIFKEIETGTTEKTESYAG